MLYSDSVLPEAFDSEMRNIKVRSPLSTYFTIDEGNNFAMSTAGNDSSQVCSKHQGLRPMGLFDRLFGNHHRSKHHGRKVHSSGKYADRLPACNRDQAILKCPSCKVFNSDTARFCHQCGVSIVAPTCSQCRNTFQPGARFCAHCGQAAP